MNDKTIFLIINQGFSSRYLLRSEIFSIIKDSGVRIVIVSPSSDEKYFCEEFKGKNIFHEKYKINRYRNKNSKLALFFTLARLYSFKGPNNFTDYWRNHYFSQRMDLPFKKKLYDLALKTTIFFLNRSVLARKAFISIESLLTYKVHQEIFDKYRPSLVITTSLGMLPYDRFIMHEANRNGAKVVSMILSWDNTTTKGIAGAKADYVVAWTEIMKAELVDYHDIAPEKIFVGGVVQYEEYFKGNNLLSKEELFKKFGMDLNKKTILYCLESPTAYKWNPKLVDMMGRIIVAGKIDHPCQIIIRLHPIYYRIENEKYVYEKDINDLKVLAKKYSFIFFDHPEVLSGKMSHDMPLFETYKLGSLLKYSDIVMCFYSSMSIEASIFDTPVINVGIYHKKNIPNEVMANHVHNKRVLCTGGVKSVHDEDELIKEINNYFRDPSIDADGRTRIVEQETGPNKGKAASKIGEYLLNLLEG